EPQLIQYLQVLPAGIVRMAFEAAFKPGSPVGPLENSIDKQPEVLRGEESRRPATQVQFPDHRPFAQQFPVKLPFLQDRPDIGFFHFVSFGDAFMATAKSTHAFTKREVDIQTDSLGGVCFAKTPFKAFFVSPT